MYDSLNNFKVHRIIAAELTPKRISDADDLFVVYERNCGHILLCKLHNILHTLGTGLLLTPSISSSIISTNIVFLH